MAGNLMVESIKAQHGVSTPIEGFVALQLDEHVGPAVYESRSDGGRSFHHGLLGQSGTFWLDDDEEADVLCALTASENLIHFYRTAAGAKRKQTLKNARFFRPVTSIPRPGAGGAVGETAVRFACDVEESDTIALQRVVADAA